MKDGKIFSLVSSTLSWKKGLSTKKLETHWYLKSVMKYTKHLSALFPLFGKGTQTSASFIGVFYFSLLREVLST
jgi:hypothetical protein